MNNLKDLFAEMMDENFKFDEERFGFELENEDVVGENDDLVESHHKTSKKSKSYKQPYSPSYFKMDQVKAEMKAGKDNQNVILQTLWRVSPVSTDEERSSDFKLIKSLGRSKKWSKCFIEFKWSAEQQSLKSDKKIKPEQRGTGLSRPFNERKARWKMFNGYGFRHRKQVIEFIKQLEEMKSKEVN